MKIKIIVFFSFSLSISWTYSRQIEVCPTCPIETIQSALTIAAPGDTLLVKSGFYEENTLIIDKPLVLWGVDLPVVQNKENGEVFTIRGNDIVIRGFQIQNVSTSFVADNAAIKIENARDCLIEGNQILNTFFGIYLKRSRNIIVKNNQIRGEAVYEITSGNGVHLWHCQNITITGNLVRNHRDGYYFEFVDNSLINNNVSEHNIRYGLHFMFSNYNRYLGNLFKENGAGVAVMFSKFITMTNNTFDHNWGSSSYGLLLKEISDGEISGNSFLNNTIGIYGEGANRLIIQNNNFIDNGWALKILGSCLDNIFTKNNFISNTFDLSTNSLQQHNSYDQNYWSKYNGYDLDKDGFGDVPYQPVTLFSFIVARSNPSIILLRSLFIDMLEFAEKITPMLTPTVLIDERPLMKPL